MVVRDGFCIFTAFLEHLSEAQVYGTVRIVIAEGVHIGAGCFCCVVYKAIAFSDAISDIPAQVALLGRCFCIHFPIDSGCLIVFPNPLLLFRIAQFGGFAGI